MNAYFVNIPNEERENILNKHKEVYNGYRTINPAAVEKELPLYVQDFANDKGGLVVNNKGDVKQYTNIGINEARHRKPYLAKEEEEELDEYFYFPPDDDGNYGKKDDPTRQSDLDSALSIFDKLEDEEDEEDEDELFESEHVCEQCGLKESLCECGDYMEEGECNECDDMYEYVVDDDLFEQANIISSELDTPMSKSAYSYISGGPDQYSGDGEDYEEGYEEDIQKIQNMFDYASQHDSDPDTKEMMRDLDKTMNNDFDGSEPSDDEWEAFDFVSGGPPGVTFHEAIEEDEEEVEEEVDEDLRESFAKQRQLTLEMFQRFNKYN